MSGNAWQINDQAAYVVTNPQRVIAINLDQPGRQPKALLGTGAAIWLYLLSDDDQAPHPLVLEDELIDALAEQFGMTAEQIAPDVQGFLQQLQANDLLVRRGAAVPA